MIFAMKFQDDIIYCYFGIVILFFVNKDCNDQYLWSLQSKMLLFKPAWAWKGKGVGGRGKGA